MVAKIRTIAVRPEQIEQGIGYLRNTMLPAARELEGFRGMIGLLDEESGKAVTVTLWDTEDALQASEDRGASLRAKGGAPQAGATVERYVVSLTEIPEPLTI
jgi:heme-degrading monooxygenase HmoA